MQVGHLFSEDLVVRYDHYVQLTLSLCPNLLLCITLKARPMSTANFDSSGR